MADTSPCAENIEQGECHEVEIMMVSFLDKSISMTKR